MKFTYICNNCPQLSITEAEQERLRLHGEEREKIALPKGKGLTEPHIPYVLDIPSTLKMTPEM